MSVLSSSKDDLARLKRKVINDRYTLVRLINSGAYGTVWEVEDNQFPGVPIAIKLAKTSFADDASSFFTREAQLLRRLEHPNIVRVYDYGFWEGEGQAFIVMDLLHGETLTAVLRQQGEQLPHQLLVKFVSEIGSALEHAHEHECVHRDLKPDNILFVKTGAQGAKTRKLAEKFVLVDFGIATKTDDTRTLNNSTCTGLGTPEYRSPEQIMSTRELRLDENPSTDIYTFGVILYQVLAGRVPFRMKNDSQAAFAAVTHQIGNEKPPRLSELAPDRAIPAAIEELVLQCLEKDPVRRPQTISEIRKRFLEVVDGVSEGASRIAPAHLATTLTPHGDTERAPLSKTRPAERRQWSIQKRSPLRHLFWAVPCVAAIAFALFWWVRTSPKPDSSIPDDTAETPVAAIQPARPEPAETEKLEPKPSAFQIGFAETNPDVPSQTVYLRLPKSVIDPTEIVVSSVSGSKDGRGKGLEIASPKKIEADLFSADVRLTNPNLEARTYLYEFTVRATGGASLTSKALAITVKPPKTKIPAGFVPDLDFSQPQQTVGKAVYYKRLLYDGPVALDPQDKKLLAFDLVDVEHPFYLMEYEVWNHLFAQWGKRATTAFEVTKVKNPNRQPNPRWPVENVTQQEAVDFAKWLFPAKVDVGLPTEAEWMAAYKKGGGDDWALKIASKRTPQFAINLEKPNEIGKSTDDFVRAFTDERRPVGFYDMAGNVGEWIFSPTENGNYPRHIGNRFGEEELNKPSASPSPERAEEIGFRLVVHVAP